MTYVLDPALTRDLTEAKAALARHGIVIIRTVETDLPPVIMAEARASMEASPRKLARMGEDELDAFVAKLRKTAMKSTAELKDLYVRLLARLGTEFLGELVGDLEGIDQLFKWRRISESFDPVNELLKEEGFGPVAIDGPEDVSPAFKVELEERWDSAYVRFKLLAEQAAEEMRRQDAEQGKAAGQAKAKKPRKR